MGNPEERPGEKSVNNYDAYFFQFQRNGQCNGIKRCFLQRRKQCQNILLRTIPGQRTKLMNPAR